MTPPRPSGECDYQLFVNQTGRVSARCEHCNQNMAHGVITGQLNRYNKVRLQNEALIKSLKYCVDNLEKMGELAICARARNVFRGTDDGKEDQT